MISAIWSLANSIISTVVRYGHHHISLSTNIVPDLMLCPPYLAAFFFLGSDFSISMDYGTTQAQLRPALLAFSVVLL